MIRKSSILLILCLLFYDCNARIYYVSNSGNDNFNGTSKLTAWQSIAKVNTVTIAAGDSVLFEGGFTFNGALYLPPSASGIVKNPILIGSYGSGKAKLYSNNTHGILAYNNQNIIIENLLIEGSGYLNNNGAGVYFYMDIPGNAHLDNIVIRGVETSGFRLAGIRIESYPSDGLRSGYNNVLVENSIARNNGLVGISVQGYYLTSDTLYSHRNIKINRCIVHHNDGIVGWNSHSGNGILIGQTDSAVINYCEAYENGKNNTYGPAGPCGIWAWDSKHIRIEYNYSHHNRTQTKDGDGFDLDGGVQNSVMQYNYSYANDGPGFLVAQFTGARKMKNNIVRYNISEKDGKGLGILIWSGDPAGKITTENIDVYNNTVFIDTIGDANSNAAFAVYCNNGAVRNIRVCNNIFITKNNCNFIDIYTAANLKFYNNLYYNFTNSFRVRDNGILYTSFSNWQASTGQEIYNGNKVGIVANPNLINPGRQGGIPNVDSLRTIRSYQFKLKSTYFHKGIWIDSLLGAKDVLLDFYGDTLDKKGKYSHGAHDIKPIKASFEVAKNCLGDSTKFVNKSELALSCRWKFGDNTGSTLFNPKHKYNLPSTFTATLYIYGKLGYIDSIKRTVSILDLPKADFLFNNVCEGDTAVFVNTSKNATNFAWYFDNTILDTINLIKKIKTNSVDTIAMKLIVSNQKLCYDSIVKQLLILGKPKIVLKYDATCANIPVNLINESINTSKLYCEMGDGSRFYLKKDTQYLFNSSGTFNSFFSALSDAGCKDSLKQTITINPLPVALFQFDTVCFGKATHFQNLSSDSCSYSWKFGASDSTKTKSPDFIVPNPDSIKVNLLVENQYKCKNTLSKTVVVNNLPNPSFVHSTQNGMLTIKAIDTILKHYQWFLNDTLVGSNSYLLELSPARSGTLKLKLNAKNSKGCDASFSDTINFTKSNLGFELNKKNTLSIYPNPFVNQIFIESELIDKKPTSFALYTIHGQLVMQKTIINVTAKKIQIDSLENVKSGIYLIEISTNKNKLVSRIVK